MTDFAKLILDADTRGLQEGQRELKRTGSQASRTAQDVDRSANAMSSAFKRVGAGLAAFGAGQVLLGFGRSSVQAAIDAQEMGSAFEVVFGDMAADVRAWAEETGNALGRSTQEIQRSALAFQELFGKALAPEQAAELSKQFAVLTQDLASFKNLSNEVAQQKLFSGLVGEAEPLRAVGVFLDEAALKAKAAALGMGDFSKELTAQEKIVVRAAVIQEQLAQASGDVERTSGSTANQIKTYQAAVEELQVAIGQKLLPTLTPLITAAAQTVTSFAQLAQGFSGTGVSLSGLMRIVGTAVSGWAAYRLTLLAAATAQGVYTTAMVAATRVIGAAQAGTIGLNAAMAANPFGAVATAVGVLTASFVGLSQAQRQARAETNNLITSLRAAAQARSADFLSQRAQLQGQFNEAKRALDDLRERQRAGSSGFAGGFFLGAANVSINEELSAQNREVSRLRLELQLADEAYKAAGEAAESIVVPTGQAADGVGKLSKELRGGSDAAKEAAEAFQSLYDRLRPREAAERQLQADRMLIESRKDLTQATKDELIALLELESFRERTSGLGPARVSAGLLNQGSLAVANGDMDRNIEQINAEIRATKVLQETGNVAASIKILKDAARDGTQSVAENFGQMADRTLQALDRMVSAIRGGGFLDILSSVINFGIQLGGMGAFGSNVQAKILARANGGQVNAGRTYLVGERGPELFSPATNGQIVANDNMRGGGMVINVDARGASDPEAVRQQVERGILEAAPAIVAAAQQRTITTLRRPRLAGAL